MSYVGRVSNPSGLTMASQRGPNYVMNKEDKMPFKSQAQAKKFRVMESQGEIPKGTSDKWAHETKSIKSLPEHVKAKDSRHGEHR